MKQVNLLLAVFVSAGFSVAQSPSLIGRSGLPLCVSTSKTTSLIFPYAIRHVDRGSPEVVVEHVRDAENILLVKGANRRFAETNLSVICADGNLYSFRVQYDSLPPEWIFNVHSAVQPEAKSSLVKFADAENHANIDFYMNGVLFRNANVRSVDKEHWGIRFSVDGIYVKKEVLFFRISVRNNSAIDFDVESIQFVIRDIVKSRRTAIQELPIHPIKFNNSLQSVSSGEKSTIVVALPKFTIPDRKYLSIQLFERNGGRGLTLKVYNRQLVRAEKLSP